MSNLLTEVTGVTVDSGSWMPGQPAAYRFYEPYEDTPYYVGMAENLPQRFHAHRRAGLCMAAGRIEVWPCESAIATSRLERNLILLFQPSQNRLIPKASENELRWYDTIRRATQWDDSEESLGYCPTCGELQVGSTRLLPNRDLR